MSYMRIPKELLRGECPVSRFIWRVKPPWHSLKLCRRLRQGFFWAAGLVVVSATILGSLTALAAEPELRADRIKAALLFYMAKFVTWPGELRESSQDFQLCAGVGQPLFQEQRKVFEEKLLHGRKVAVRRFLAEELREDGLSKCDLLYVAREFLDQFQENLPLLERKGLLVVMEGRETLGHGAMIAVFTDSNRLRFSVDLNYLRSQELEASSELLQLASEVTE